MLAVATNIDLSTVPNRDTVELTIYNSEDLTLVRETRGLSFSPGVNRLQFSWSNTLIDPTSVEIRFPQAAEKLRLVDTTFPHDKPEMLYWNINSELDGEATVEISYFTSGLTWNADYVVVANAPESHSRIEGFIKVHNRSGEEYTRARVRVVVGTINLVEKIAELARVPLTEVPHLQPVQRGALRLQAAKRMMTAESAGRAAPARADSATSARPKAIIKEGLSEYFIFSIEGTETIPNGWSKRLRSFEASQVPIEVRYRYRLAEYGDRLVRLYITKNDEAAGLGSTPLPGGEVRVFRDSGSDSLAYQAAQTIKYIPVGDKLVLNLGVDPNVGFERELLRSWRDEIWLKLPKANRFYRMRDRVTVVERDAKIAGWNAHALFSQRIRNFTGREILVDIRRTIAGDATFASRLSAQRHDFQSVDFKAEVGPGVTRDLLYEVVIKQGHNAKQRRLELESRDIVRPSY